MAAPAAATVPAAGAIVWKQQFGTAKSDSISRLSIDGSGNVIAYGSTAGALNGASKGGTDVFLAKFSPAGVQIWLRQLGVAQNDRPIGLAVSSTSEIVIAGSIALAGSDGTPLQWFLAKYSSGGTLAWKRTFNTAVPAAIALTSGGQIVAVTAAGDYLEQYSSTGTLLWRQPITGAEFWDACCLAIDGGGNIIVGGDRWGATLTGTVAKFTAAGSQIWQHDLGWVEYGHFTGITTDAHSNVIAVGFADTTNAYGVFDHTDVMAKWRADGTHPIGDVDFPLIASIRTTSSSRPSGVAVNNAGDIFISGSASIYGLANSDAVVTALGGDGTERWRVLYSTAGMDYANAVAAGPNGALYVGGSTNGALGAAQKGGGDAFLLKLSQQ